MTLNGVEALAGLAPGGEAPAGLALCQRREAVAVACTAAEGEVLAAVEPRVEEVEGYEVCTWVTVSWQQIHVRGATSAEQSPLSYRTGYTGVQNRVHWRAETSSSIAL